MTFAYVLPSDDTLAEHLLAHLLCAGFAPDPDPVVRFCEEELADVVLGPDEPPA